MAKGLAEVLRFGRYEPLFRIGVGGMAEVYAARIRGEAGFQKLVAVKRMLPHLSGDQRFVNMFLDEARLAANVTSPHVVQTLDLGRTDEDALYIVMELIVGVTLADVVRSAVALDPPVALDLLAQAAQGLDDAHEARAPSGESLQLVHRDVSPQNILIGIDGRARVTDFGIAHAMTQRRTHTRVGEVKGKFSYFSPEQAAGRGVDRRSDVFSLGIVAWELLTGRRLFKGKPSEALAAVREKPIRPLLELRPDLGADVSRAVMTALERDPDRRHATAGQLAAALKRAALYFGEPPSPRVVGSLVAEVGGDSLSQVQARLAKAGAPESVTGTVILPEHAADAAPASDTRSLHTGDLLPQPEEPTLAEHDPTVAEEDRTVSEGAPTTGATALERPEELGGAPTAPYEPTPITRGPIPQAHRPVVVRERPSTRRWIVASVAVAAVAIGVGGALAFFAPEGEPEPSAGEVVTDRPPASASPSDTGSATVGGAEQRGEPEGAPAGAQADEPVVAPLAAAPDTASDPSPSSADADEPSPAAEETDRSPEPTATQRARRRDAMRRRRAAHRRAARRSSGGSSGSRTGTSSSAMQDSPLPGLDAFDRAVQR